MCRRSLAILSLLFAAASPSLALAETSLEPVVLYERQPAAEELGRYYLAGSETYVDKTWTLDRIKAEFSKVTWGPKITRVELLYTSHRNNRPSDINDPYHVHNPDGLPYLEVTSLCETVYERPMRDDERERYLVRVGVHRPDALYTEPYFENASRDSNWGDDVLKIERFYFFARDTHVIRPCFRETRLTVDQAKLDAQHNAQWSQLKEKCAIGHDLPPYKYKLDESSPRHGFWAEVHEVYLDKKTELKCDVEQFEAAHDRGLHEVIRRLLEEPRVARVCPEIEKVDFGYVLVSADRNNPGYLMTKVPCLVRKIAWLTGGNHIIILSSLAPDKFDVARQIMPIYGKVFPSDIPKEFKFDLTQWGHDEMEYQLEAMKDALASQEYHVDGNDPFVDAMGQAASYVYMPIQQEWGYAPTKPKAHQQKIYDRVREWWAKNKDAMQWNESMHQLAIVGQSPQELAERAKQDETERRAAILASPVAKTKEQLKDALIQRYEMEKKKWAEGAGERAVSFDRNENGGWTWRWRQLAEGPVYDFTINDPVLKEQDDQRYPFKAEVLSSYVDNGKVYPQLEVFYYDKLNDRWIREKGR